MKKIYMILAAITLLSMSLNAQLLPGKGNGNFMFMPTGTATMAAHNNQFRLPNLASGQYLVGPYVSDDFEETGLSFYNFYNQGQNVTPVVDLPRAEWEEHLGDSIIGFRFALAGSSTVRVYDFGMYPGSASYWATDSYTIWQIGGLQGGVEVTPKLSVSTGSITINGNNTTTATFTVTGTNLTDNVTITATNGFTVSPTTITPSNGSVNQTVTVTAPSGATSEVDGVVTIATNGAASKTVIVNYTLGPVQLLHEAFGGVTATSDGSTNIASSLDTYCDNAGWTGTNIYEANGGLRVSSRNNSGTLITPAMDLSSSGGTITVKFNAMSYNANNAAPITVSCGNASQSVSIAGGSATDYTVVLTGVTAATGQKVTFTSTGTSSNTRRWYVYSVDIYSGDASSRATLRSGNRDVGTVTVGEGTTSNSNLPVYGWYNDYGYQNQMIYSKNQIGLTSGSQITSLTLYPREGYGINFAGGTIVVKLGNTTTDNFGTTSGTANKISPSDLTTVATVTPVNDASATSWTITFTTPFTYTGDNLLLQFDHEGGNYNYTYSYFMGDMQSTYISLINGSSTALTSTTGTKSQFLPKATFGYDGTPAVVVPEYLELDGGEWYDFYLDEPVEFTMADTISTIAIGYTYYQEYSSSHAPVAYNTNSTGHYHYANMYAYDNDEGAYVKLFWGLGQSPATYMPGDLAVQLIFKSSMEKTESPTISYTYDAGTYYITATAPASDPNAEVTLTLSNGQTATGTGSVTIPVGRSDSNYDVTATATAQAEGKAVSDPTTQTVTIEASALTPTPTPTIGSQVLDLTVMVTGSGEGEVHMYIDSQEVTSPTYLERTDEDYYVTVTVTAQIQDTQHSMATTTQQVLVPKLENIDLTGWTQLPGLFNNDEVIILSNNLMFVDRFTASTANNNQAPKYIYKMTENEGKLTERRETNEHIIPVQLTRSKVWGYYTEQDVLDDTLRQVVDTCLMNAEIEMYLEHSNDIYYYTLDRSRNSILDADFLDLSHLQNDNVKYVEMSEYFLPVHEPFNFGAMTRFDSIDVVLPASAPQGVDGKHYGKYDNGDYFAYVPIIWTFGNDPTNTRLNWDNDHKHNSYGSPIWQTGVGKVELIGKPKLERQEGKNGSTNWTEGDVPCSIYMITDLQAWGYLPNPEVSNIEYEPYMFRVWVESEKDILRDFVWVEGDPDDLDNRPGTHFEGTGIIPANTPFLVWEEEITDQGSDNIADGDAANVTVFHKLKVTDTETVDGDVHWTAPQELNMLFAAPDSLKAKDIKIYVRFYYRSTGNALHQDQQNGMYLMGLRAVGDNGFYGTEGEGDPDDEIPTFIQGVYVNNSHGEVVSVSYYNTQGMKSNKPFDGINIVVTRYSDGTSSTTKVMH